MTLRKSGLLRYLAMVSRNSCKVDSNLHLASVNMNLQVREFAWSLLLRPVVKTKWIVTTRIALVTLFRYDVGDSFRCSYFMFWIELCLQRNWLCGYLPMWIEDTWLLLLRQVMMWWQIVRYILSLIASVLCVVGDNVDVIPFERML